MPRLRPVLAPWALLALLLACAPAAQAVPAGSAHYRFTATDRLDAMLDAAFDMTESRTQRQVMDTDGDGIVSEAEVAASRGATIATVRALSSGIGLPTGRLLVDGGQSTSAEVDLTYGHAAGPVEQPVTLTMAWTLTLHLDVAPNATHQVEMDTLNFSRAGHIQMDVTSLLFEMPPGWKVGASGGLPLYAVVAPGGERVTFPTGVAGTDRVTLILERDDPSRGLAGPGALAILALGASARLARRSRGS